MIKHILTRLLNHLVNQNAWAREQLAPHGGKSVCFNIPPVRATLTVLEDGGLAMAGDAADAEATVTIPLPVAMRLLANDDAATTLSTLEGDTELVGTSVEERELELREQRADVGRRGVEQLTDGGQRHAGLVHSHGNLQVRRARSERRQHWPRLGLLRFTG